MASTTTTEKADTSKGELTKESKHKDERFEDSQELKPVRHYPLAATSTDDFVTKEIEEDEIDEDEDEETAAERKKSAAAARKSYAKSKG